MPTEGVRRTRARAGIMAAALLGTTMLAGLPAVAETEVPAPAFDVRAVVTEAAPSIVSVEGIGTGAPIVRRLPNEAMLEHFAERFGVKLPDNAVQPGIAVTGRAPGLVTSDDGQILTSASALEGATTIRVTLDDGQEFDAVVLGKDEMTDLAVIKIEATGLTPVHFATSAETGDAVTVPGAKIGSRRSVSAGVVSGISDTTESIFDLIETDAGVGWGNQGGPLLNAAGEVVGVNAQHLQSADGGAGMTVAVPSSVVEAVLADVSDDGRVERGFLGVQISPVSDDVAAALGLEANTGAFVDAVTEDSPAASAGLKRGDIVLSVSGSDIRTPRDLTRSIAGDKPGAEVSIQLLRAGQPMTLSATLGNRSA
jgi:serine protease Do